MAYRLAALVGAFDALIAVAQPFNVVVVKLPQELGLLPASEVTLARLPDVAGTPVLPAEKRVYFRKLSPALMWLARDASASAMIGYVEAEYFGGVGYQAVIAWDGAAIAFGPHKASNDPDELNVTKWEPPLHKQPINRLLRRMGVQATVSQDEFDTVGLGRYRSTDDWVMSVEETEEDLE